jgi:ABC-type branched-subunit amino acid transport system substrate-binding protein
MPVRLKHIPVVMLSMAAGLATIVVAACSEDAAAPATVDAGTDAPPIANDATVCPPAPARSCTNAGCTQTLGAPAVCVDDKCVQLTTPDCPRVEGAVENDDAIVFGVVHSNRGPNTASGDQCNNAIAFGVKEINAVGGIPSADPCKKSRPLAFVACDDTNLVLDSDGGTKTYVAPDGGTEPSPREKTLDHLAADLKVPVVVGGVSSGDVLAMGKYLISKHKTMFFTTRGSTNLLVDIPNDGFEPDGYRLMWRGTQNVLIQAKALQKVYVELEAQAKVAHGKSTIKLAIVLKNDAYGQGLGTAFKTGLLVNGTAYSGSVGSDPNVLDQMYQFTDGSGAGDSKPVALQKITSFNPDIIVAVGTDEIVSAFVTPIEDSVKALPEQQKPLWLGAHGLRTGSLTSYVDSLTDAAQKTSLLGRTRGTFPGGITALAQSFLNVKFKTEYPSAQDIPGVREGYDITYILGYAMTAAAAKGPVTSESVVKNMDAIVEGTSKTDVGSALFAQASRRVAGGEKINLNGTFSALDFDLTTGEAPADNSIWCVYLDPNTGKSVFNPAAGEFYDAAQDKLIGSFKCQ